MTVCVGINVNNDEDCCEPITVHHLLLSTTKNKHLMRGKQHVVDLGPDLQNILGKILSLS